MASVTNHELVTSYVDGELEEADMRAVEAAAEGDKRMRLAIDAEMATKTAIGKRAPRMEAPDYLRARVLKALEGDVVVALQHTA